MSQPEEHRTITINPDALKLPNNKSRKKRGPTQIKIKPNSEKKQKPSTLKRNLLNIIRKNQESRLKRDKKQRESLDPPKNDPIVPQTDFEQSVQFLKNLPKIGPSLNPTKLPVINHNQTFKHYSPLDEETSIPMIPLNYDSDVVAINPVYPKIELNSSPSMYVNTPPPPFGVLKNGSKPTYRSWKSQTQKNVDNGPKRIKSEIAPSPTQINYETRLKDQIKTMSERAQKENLHNTHVNDNRRKQKKQKRTIRRTYRIGKSKVHPRVSVLVSNKTLRNKANLHKLKLRETPISDVKQFLRKQGFIKVGTSTPNEVLRKMYESAQLICGEVYNHNPENLLYNYFNDTES